MGTTPYISLKNQTNKQQKKNLLISMTILERAVCSLYYYYHPSYHVSLDCHPLSCLAYFYAPAPIPGPNVIGTLCLWNWERCMWLLSLFTLPLYVLYACTWRPENGFLLPPGRSQELNSGWWQVPLTTKLSCWPPWRQDIKANNLKYTQEYGKCSSSGGWEVAFQRITGWSCDYLIDIGLQVAQALNMLCSWGWPWAPDSLAS